MLMYFMLFHFKTIELEIFTLILNDRSYDPSSSKVNVALILERPKYKEK